MRKDDHTENILNEVLSEHPGTAFPETLKFNAKCPFKSSTLRGEKHGGEREHRELSYNEESPIRLTLIS